MLQIKAFMNIASLISNNPGVVSTLGELSEQARTYVKERGEYSLALQPGYDLVVFKSMDTVTGSRFVLSNSQVSQITDVVKDMQSYATTHPRPYSQTDFRDWVAAHFYGKISDLEISSIVSADNYGLPEWASWTSIEHGGVYVKVWLSDDAFRSQYDEYAIESILPLANIDDFFAFFNTVKSKLAARSDNWLNEAIETTRGVSPETYTRFYRFNFVNSLNTSETYPVEFPSLIYGMAGDNIDAIKDAIVEKIMSLTKHTRQEWEVIFPDLFKRTEFVLLPRWERIAIPNLTDLGAVFSPILKPAECLDFAKANVPFYTPSHVAANIYTTTLLYRSLACVVVAGETNIEGKKTLWQVIPDYIVVNTSSPDFARMSLKTQEWITMINDMVRYAETVTEFSSTPKTYRKIKRGNLLFLSGVYNNVNFLVAAKSNPIYNTTVDV